MPCTTWMSHKALLRCLPFLSYDKNEYGDLIVNRKEAEIVSLTFDLYLMNVGSSRITILSSLAQDESRSISENCTWGIRRRFETGKHKMSTKRFLGYDADEMGKLVINRTQEPIVIRLYQEFLDGKTTDHIKRIFEREGVKNWDGGTKWQSTTLMSMLENEKYKGDALLQKSYTVDFLTKKRTQNKGEI